MMVKFEYGAILKGSQTGKKLVEKVIQFEYGAILKGSQTVGRVYSSDSLFEYGAILKGSQTHINLLKMLTPLSMVQF